MFHSMDKDDTFKCNGTSTRAGRQILLSGGGSGGHVFPALALADELLRRGWQVSYAGHAEGPEARLVPARGIPFYALAARPVVGRDLFAQARALVTLLRSSLSARALVRQLAVRAVAATGGYAAMPAALGARLARRPLLLVEPNAQAGLANRALSRLASEAAIAYAATADSLHCPSTVTGVPVRRAFHEIGPLEPRPPLRLLVLGGSQGARQLNRMVPAALCRLGRQTDLRVVHQSGPARLEEAQAAYAEAGLAARPGIEIVPFLDHVHTVMARCHLVISRAGAITLAELCAAGRASVLLPLGLAGGHQVDNARGLERAGAARVLVGPDATPEALAALLAGLFAQPVASGDDALATMAAAARGLARRDAAALIADRVERLAGGRRD